MPKLSIIILCFKAEEYSKIYLTRVLDILKNNEIDDYEIMLVGNYIPKSNDKTPEIIKSLSESNKNIVAIAEPKPEFGWLGWDVRMAFDKAKGDFIALIDGDGQMPAEDIPKCYFASVENDADITMTYRKTRGDGLYRKALSFTYNLCIQILFPCCKVRDLNSKPKVIKKELLNDLNLKSNGWTIDAEIMLQSMKRKIKLIQQPTNFLGQPGGRDSFVGYKAIFEFIIFLLKQRLFGIK
jgi:glycosyltransferase involved in cell wall biosynthesis